MDIRKILRRNNNMDRGQALNRQDELYRLLKKSLDKATNEKIEKDHKEAIASGMKVYKRGDRILNRYEVFKSIDGGMGKVYLCYDLEWKIPIAVKTILPKYFKNKKAKVKERFKKEALTWVNLDRHYNIVTAFYVEDVDHLPAIFMEMIFGDKIYGNDLSGYLGRYRFKTEEALKLAVRLCDGMIHSKNKFKEMGKVFVHRDIKPNNIMITEDMVPKITDFGLVKSELEDRTWGGTPGYMSPEQFNGDTVDIRSDIYSFGCVLYEMFCGGRRPYNLNVKELENIDRKDLGRALQQKHLKEKMIHPLPFIPESKVKNEIGDVIIKCLEKQRDSRFTDFIELRDILENLYTELTGEKIPYIKGEELDAFEWTNKGHSFVNLGRYEKALNCCNKALKINPGFTGAWNNKGISLSYLGRNKEAIECYKEALRINPKDAKICNNKGNILSDLGRHQEAFECFDEALEINPEYAKALYSKGKALYKLFKLGESIKYFEKAIEIYPEFSDAWNGKGLTINDLGKHQEAIECFDLAIAYSPENANAWNSKGLALIRLGRPEEATRCFDKALAINPEYAEAWNNKGGILFETGRVKEATEYYDKALKINPEYPDAWYNKGNYMLISGRYKEAIEFYDKALEINPEYVDALNNKGASLEKLGITEKAIEYYDMALEINPEFAGAWFNKWVALFNSGMMDESGMACLKKAANLGFPQAVAMLKRFGIK